ARAPLPGRAAGAGAPRLRGGGAGTPPVVRLGAGGLGPRPPSPPVFGPAARRNTRETPEIPPGNGNRLALRPGPAAGATSAARTWPQPPGRVDVHERRRGSEVHRR